MKRKVKSWEDLLLIGELKGLGGIHKNGAIYTFGEGMREYCGKELDMVVVEDSPITKLMYEGWGIEEWMLEPIIATENSLRHAVEEVLEVLNGEGIPNLNWIDNRLRRALND